MLNLSYFDQNVEDIRNKRVILRVDYNIPIENGEVRDDTRILQSKRTIDFLFDLNCDIILLTHLGRPKTAEDRKKYTTRNILNYLNSKKLFNIDVDFVDNFEKEIHYNGGKIYLFENVRFFEGETKNSLDLAKNFSKYGDVFVNDAFGSLHRVHSSVAGISNFLPTYFGFLVKNEVENLSKFFNPVSPFTVILGGAKISDKLGLIKKIKADNVIVCGAMALTIYRKMGKNIGRSLFEDVDVADLIGNPRIILPDTFVVVDEKFEKQSVRTIDDIGDMVVVDTVMSDKILSTIKGSKMVFWNGPVGIFEKGFEDGSLSILQALAQTDGFRAVGGGDTVRFVNTVLSSDYSKSVDFISTGGGATLEFLEKETLEAVEYINQNIVRR
ncbi:MAG: phosphoglycerate kinase [bacterium]|nr:phosphoglycerate kinase [bacterium]